MFHPPAEVLLGLMAVGVFSLFMLDSESKPHRLVRWALSAKARRTVKALFDIRRWKSFLYEFTPVTPPMSLRGLQKLVGEWTSTTFVSPGGLGAANHIRDESKEVIDLLEEIIAKQGSLKNMTAEQRYKLGLELADLVILVVDIAYVQGVDLTDATLLKHHINTLRKWGKPDERGVQHHIEEEIPSKDAKFVTARSEAEIQALKTNLDGIGEKKLAAILAKPDPLILRALDDILDDDDEF